MKDEGVLNAGIPNMPVFIDVVCVSKPLEGKGRGLEEREGLKAATVLGGAEFI